ncbi:hypothetical protein C5167_012774 [Papaver somniferum]|uniref:Uncharacterized protein n=1 Tax=Papaver somniferum TaxID=3469 RepID=A0A4Y7J2F5_PAPSO|nr:hypothetical protein C5167_012774 [Papaver somniferum]
MNGFLFFFSFKFQENFLNYLFKFGILMETRVEILPEEVHFLAHYGSRSCTPLFFVYVTSFVEVRIGKMKRSSFVVAAPKCYSLSSRNDSSVYVEAELGMKIACGFEMMYKQRRHENLDGKGTSTWEAFKESLEISGYFKQLLPGSIIAFPGQEFKGLELPPSGNDACLYFSEDELKLAMQKYSQKANTKKDADHSAESAANDSDLGDIVNSLTRILACPLALGVKPNY